MSEYRKDSAEADLMQDEIIAPHDIFYEEITAFLSVFFFSFLLSSFEDNVLWLNFEC